jgi:hypothetical protein
LARLDRKRKKKGSNQEWMSPSDPDARITKMKDGRTHLAHKAEHAVDLTSGALLAVTLQPANEGDTTTIHKTLEEAQAAAREMNQAGVEEVVADRAITVALYSRKCTIRKSGVTFPNRSGADGTGRVREKWKSRSGRMRIGGGCEENATSGYRNCRAN